MSGSASGAAEATLALSMTIAAYLMRGRLISFTKKRIDGTNQRQRRKRSRQTRTRS